MKQFLIFSATISSLLSLSTAYASESARCSENQRPALNQWLGYCAQIGAVKIVHDMGNGILINISDPVVCLLGIMGKFMIAKAAQEFVSVDMFAFDRNYDWAAMDNNYAGFWGWLIASGSRATAADTEIGIKPLISIRIS